MNNNKIITWYEKCFEGKKCDRNKCQIWEVVGKGLWWKELREAGGAGGHWGSCRENSRYGPQPDGHSHSFMQMTLLHPHHTPGEAVIVPL